MNISVSVVSSFLFVYEVRRLWFIMLNVGIKVIKFDFQSYIPNNKYLPKFIIQAITVKIDVT